MNPNPATSTNSAMPAAKARPKFDEQELRQRSLWTVPETAFMCRVGDRTVWRLMNDPRSDFPGPRRVGGRTLLARDEVFAFLRLPRGATPS